MLQSLANVAAYLVESTEKTLAARKWCRQYVSETVA